MVGPVLRDFLRPDVAGHGRRGPAGLPGAAALGEVLRRDAGPAAYVFGVIPPALYLLSYWAWFASGTAVNRYEVGQSIGERQWWQPPDAIRSLWHYTYKAFHFHSTLTNSAGNHHRRSPSRGRGRCRYGRCCTRSTTTTCPAAVRRPASGGAAGRDADDVVHRGAGAAVRRVAGRGPQGTGATRWYWWDIWPAGCPGWRTSTGRCTSSTRCRWRRS